MRHEYRLFGAEMSPYSVKVRSYLRYKALPHRWVVRSADYEAEFQQHAKLQMVPLLVTPDGGSLQDSTPIIEAIDARHPDPSIHPTDPVARFVSTLLEEFGDEWGSKWLFHLRWAREVDQISSACRMASAMMPGADPDRIAAMSAMVRTGMVDRVSWFVGSSPENAPVIEDSFAEAIDLLDRHLADRPYLFGGRPAFGDFGLWAQIYEAWTDPTARAQIEGRGHNVLAWVHRMLWPRIEGEFESWAPCEPTLAPLLERHVGALFLPWTRANERALQGRQEEFSVTLAGKQWKQKPQRYHAKSLRALREKHAATADRTAIDSLLARTGCQLDG